MPIKYGNTGYAGVNAALGAEFARNGGILGALSGGEEGRHGNMLARIQEIIGRNQLANTKQMGTNAIELGDASAQNEVLKVLGFSRNDLQDPTKKALVDQIMKVRGETGVLGAKENKEYANERAVNAGVPGVTPNLNMNAELGKIVGNSQKAEANMPFIAGASKNFGTPTAPVFMNPSVPGMNIGMTGGSETTKIDEGVDPVTFQPFKHEFRLPNAPQVMPTPPTAEEIAIADAARARRSAGGTAAGNTPPIDLMNNPLMQGIGSEPLNVSPGVRVGGNNEKATLLSTLLQALRNNRGPQPQLMPGRFGGY